MKTPNLVSFFWSTLKLSATLVFLSALVGCRYYEYTLAQLFDHGVHVKVTEIPSGDVLAGPIRRIDRYEDSQLLGHGVSVRTVGYIYPNGYRSEKLELDWREKAPKKAIPSVDAFNFSGQPGSSGATSGSVIRTF